MTTKAVAKAQEPVNLVAAIAAAARDPAVDPQKMRELLNLHRELEQDIDKRAFRAEMSLLQGEITLIATDASNPSTSSRYASYGALDAALRPIYTKHGFSVSFDTGPCDRGPEWMTVTCVVGRGAWEERHSVPIPIVTTGAKGGQVMTLTHAAGSALSYGKRYALALAFNIAVARDDDGNAAGARVITEAKARELEQLVAEINADTTKIFDMLGISSFAEVPAAAFNKTKTWILAQRKKEDA